VRVNGWRIQTKSTPILGKEALEALEHQLGTSHLPEMVYGRGLLVHFSAQLEHFVWDRGCAQGLCSPS